MANGYQWMYYVHGGEVYCPRAAERIDAAACATCGFLRGTTEAGRRTAIVCLPPRGESAREQLATLISSP